MAQSLETPKTPASTPWSFCQGLLTDTPFFVTESARLPAAVQHLGHVTDGDPGMVAERLADFVDLSEDGWGGHV